MDRVLSERPRMLTRRAAAMTALGAPLLALRAAAVSARVDLFQQGDEGVHTYRIPALIEALKGTLLAVADARHDSARDMPAHISLVMPQESRPRPDVVARGHDSPGSRRRCRRRISPAGSPHRPNLVLPLLRPARNWIRHRQSGRTNRGRGTFQFHAMFTDNEGATWSEPRDLTPLVKDPSWQAMFATSGTHIQTSSGRYLVPMVVRDGEGVVSSRNACTDDGGKTWGIGAAIGPGTDESKCVVARPAA